MFFVVRVVEREPASDRFFVVEVVLGFLLLSAAGEVEIDFFCLFSLEVGGCKLVGVTDDFLIRFAAAVRGGDVLFGRALSHSDMS